MDAVVIVSVSGIILHRTAAAGIDAVAIVSVSGVADNRTTLAGTDAVDIVIVSGIILHRTAAAGIDAVAVVIGLAAGNSATAAWNIEPVTAVAAGDTILDKMVGAVNINAYPASCLSVVNGTNTDNAVICREYVILHYAIITEVANGAVADFDIALAVEVKTGPVVSGIADKIVAAQIQRYIIGSYLYTAFDGGNVAGKVVRAGTADDMLVVDIARGSVIVDWHARFDLIECLHRAACRRRCGRLQVTGPGRR